MDNDCYAVLVYEGSTEEHWSFITPEASKELDSYLEKRTKDGEKLNENSPILRRIYQVGIQKVIPMTDKSVDQTVERIVNRVGLRTKNGNRFDTMLNHGFRKRFETIVKMNKEIPVAVAEKLIGHKAYYDDRGNHIQLDENYFVPEIEQLFKFFEKVIPELTISDVARLEVANQKLQNEKSELEKRIPKLVDEAVERIKDELRKEGAVVEPK